MVYIIYLLTEVTSMYATFCHYSVYWEVPELQYRGDIMYYEIYLGRRALGPDEQPDEEARKSIDIDTNLVRSLLLRCV